MTVLPTLRRIADPEEEKRPTTRGRAGRILERREHAALRAPNGRAFAQGCGVGATVPVFIRAVGAPSHLGMVCMGLRPRRRGIAPPTGAGTGRGGYAPTEPYADAPWSRAPDSLRDLRSVKSKSLALGRNPVSAPIESDVVAACDAETVVRSSAISGSRWLIRVTRLTRGFFQRFRGSVYDLLTFPCRGRVDQAVDELLRFRMELNDQRSDAPGRFARRQWRPRDAALACADSRFAVRSAPRRSDAQRPHPGPVARAGSSPARGP